MNLDITKMSKIGGPPIGLANISATVPLVNYFLTFFHQKSEKKSRSLM